MRWSSASSKPERSAMTDRKSVLITGASAGIGAAAARRAASQGFNVGIGYRTDQSGAAKTAQDVEAEGGKAVLLQGDIGNPGDIKRIFAEHTTAFGGLDAFVNNAGCVSFASRIEDISPERLADMININLTGAFLAAGEAVRAMATRHGGKGGVIVNISSAAARLGGANQYADYAAAKGGIDTLTTALAMENAEDGIRVVGIRPGIIDTEIHGKGGQPNRAHDLAHIVPLKRPGTADEIGKTIAFLISDDASYITGTTIDVTGGR